jgi:protein O-GlcNAc transferase
MLSREADRHLAEGRIEAAIGLYQEALALDARDAAAVRGLARCADLLGLHREAEIAWLQLHTLDPEDREGLMHAGLQYQRLARYGEAIDCFSKVIDQTPEDHAAQTARVQCHLYSDTASAEEREEAQSAWGGLSSGHGETAMAQISSFQPERRLRIGYLSSDFHAHPVGMAVLPVLHFHDRRAVEVYAYADVERPDAATEQLRARCDGWRDISGLDDGAAARLMAEDRIDILVALTPHMDRNRPFIARARPAPVQIVFHDLCSTGIAEFDYFIADFMIAPRGSAERFSERVLRLPCRTVQAFPAEAPDVASPPFERNGVVTFGSFNNPMKLSETTIRLWSRILQAVPDSRLSLKYFDFYSDPPVIERIQGSFAANGIAADRLFLLGEADGRSNHLAHYGEVDIALDPTPFNGATTTFEALLMGAPVVALLGDRLVARSAASMLSAAGLSELVAQDTEAYVEIAAKLAADGARLAALRRFLRDRVKASSVFDARRYTRNLERYYRMAWRRRCAQTAAEDV